MLQLDNSPVHLKDIEIESRRDNKTAHVFESALTGNWGLCEKSERFKEFVCRKNELQVKLGCLLWGSRVVIPLKLKEKVSGQLHNCHPRVSQMKALSRSFVLWPNIDRDIQNTVKNSRDCQINKNNPIKAQIHPWEWTKKPRVRLHLHYAGPYHNKMFVIIVVSFLKRIDAIPNSSATSDETIEKPQTVFANFGLPEQIVTDNSSAFTSKKFETFLQRNGIQQIRELHPITLHQMVKLKGLFKHSRLH